MPNPRSTASIAGHPLHPMLVPFPIAFFVGTLGADILYLRDGDPFFFMMTEWALCAGVAIALLAAIPGFIDFVSEPRIRALGIAWGHFLGNLTVVAIEAFNLWRRHSIGPDAIEGLGVMLSLAAVLLMLVTGWLGWEMVYRRRVGISDEAPL
jgi:uncharacterized membrane protein